MAVPTSLLVAWVLAYVRGYRRPARIGTGFGRIARRRAALNDPEQRRRTVEARLGTTDWPPSPRVTALNASTGEFAGQAWIDGGMVSSANARIAEGFDEILVLAPLPRSYGGVPAVQDDVDHLRARATVALIVPDQDSISAIGPNIYDPSRRPAAADAGRAQGRRAQAIWS